MDFRLPPPRATHLPPQYDPHDRLQTPMDNRQTLAYPRAMTPDNASNMNPITC